MKRFWFIVFATVVLGIVSCSKDEDKTVYIITFDTGGGSPNHPAQYV